MGAMPSGQGEGEPASLAAEGAEDEAEGAGRGAEGAAEKDAEGCATGAGDAAGGAASGVEPVETTLHAAADNSGRAHSQACGRMMATS